VAQFPDCVFAVQLPATLLTALVRLAGPFVVVVQVYPVRVAVILLQVVP
jgi:hypothetical protein